MDYKRDPVLRVLKRDVLGGQLSQDPRVANFGRIFSELSISAGGNVIRGERLVLPQKLQPHAIQLAHGGSHLGASSAKRRLRTVIWFPGMDRAIDHFVSQCKTCQTVTEKYAKVEQQPHATPTLPWESVSIDHFGPLPDRSHILVARCDLSRFPTATFVRSTSSEDTISALTEIYSAFGFPRTQRSDNGAAFKSVRFQQFCNKHAIDHKFTAPYHPRANPAETFMKVLKKTFQSCGGSKKEMRQNGASGGPGHSNQRVGSGSSSRCEPPGEYSPKFQCPFPNQAVIHPSGLLGSSQELRPPLQVPHEIQSDGTSRSQQTGPRNFSGSK